MITFVTHLRYDNPDRIENLNTIIRYYSTNIKNCKFIFIEDDKEHNKANDVKKIQNKNLFLIYFLLLSQYNDLKALQTLVHIE